MSFASTLNTDAKPPAWIGDSSGRSFNEGFVQHSARPGERLVFNTTILNYTNTLSYVIVAARRDHPWMD